MYNELILPKRLEAVANFIKRCDILADIGTDHAYIPIFAVKNQFASHAIAADIIEGPLKIAKNNISSFCLSDKISVVKSDGLKNIEKADAIVIAGMGGNLICDILKNGEKIAKSASYIILQPMTCVLEVRKFLHNNNYTILDECIAKDTNKLYNIMVVKNGHEEKYDEEIFYHIGKINFTKKDPLLKEFTSKKINSYTKKILNMKNSSSSSVEEKCNEFVKIRNEYLRIDKLI